MRVVMVPSREAQHLPRLQTTDWDITTKTKEVSDKYKPTRHGTGKPNRANYRPP